MKAISENMKLHSLAHDIRGMLAPAQLIVDSLLDYDDGFVNARSAKIQDVVNRITMYCSDAVARPKDIFGTTPLLSDIVDDVVSVTAPLALRYGIRPKTIIENHSLCVSSAATVHRIIMNLTLNALEAVHMSGGSKIRIESHRSDSSYHIDITDDGPGLPVSIVNLFRPHQLERDKDTNLPSGLGIVSSIWAARSIGGQLLLRRTGYDGTTYRLTLP